MNVFCWMCIDSLLVYFTSFMNISLSSPTEPVGLKAPTFSSASEISKFTKKFNQNFALLCEAQAYPVPFFR